MWNGFLFENVFVHMIKVYSALRYSKHTKRYFCFIKPYYFVIIFYKLETLIFCYLVLNGHLINFLLIHSKLVNEKNFQ